MNAAAPPGVTSTLVAFTTTASRLAINIATPFGKHRYTVWPLPQMQALVTRRIASVGSTMDGSGTFSIRTSPALYITVARMVIYLLNQ
jgi:hypothetical protein